LTWKLEIVALRINKSLIKKFLTRSTGRNNVPTTTTSIEASYDKLIRLKSIPKPLVCSFANLFVKMALVTERYDPLEKRLFCYSLLTAIINVDIS
jgi:hypothetical protein